MNQPYARAGNFGNSHEMGYRMNVAETNLAAPACAVNFWTFAVPVILASTAAQGVGLLTKKLFNGDHASTQEAAMLASRLGAFWLVAGFAWIAMCKRNGAKA